MQDRILDIIVVTCNNEQYLNPCVISIVNSGILASMANLIIVNNGKQNIKAMVQNLPEVTVIDVNENVGWEGGLEEGLKISKAPFVVFQNDDTFIPQSSPFFYRQLLGNFSDDSVGAVGPITTVASGMQSIYAPNSPKLTSKAPWLIFFCVMIRKEALIKAGGIDLSLPGGDDFDLSIRLQDAGYKLLVEPRAFIIHHGFVTGSKEHGDHTVDGGWNSQKMIERTNQALIRKHGFKKWISNMNGANIVQDVFIDADLEGDIVRKHLNGDKAVLELGCGAKKTVPYSIGVDRVPKGEKIPNLFGAISQADVVADVQNDLPVEESAYDAIIARHVLEHCLDSVRTVNGWKRSIKIGGKLIIAVPDEKITKGIPLNPEHVHAFNSESLKNLLESCGFEQIDSQSSNNGSSFVSCFKRLN
jgi:O-antigen biosynthesis protein